MNELKDAKKIYESIEIPNELSLIIDKCIKNEEGKNKVVPMKKKNYIKYLTTIAAAFVLAILIGVNTSEVFADTMQNIPIIGNVMKVLTVRSYEDKNKDRNIKVEVPAIDSEKAKDVNSLIQEKIDSYVKEADERIQEYKKAFIATGGTEEEFAKHNIKVNVGYDVKYQDEDIVSFVITGTESWVSEYGLNNYYNLDIKNNKELTLKDILGDNYIEIANESIKKQMKEKSEADPNIVYFSEEKGGFTSIDENTKFYLNSSKNPVIVFDKYEVAPGFMGMQEFEITK